HGTLPGNSAGFATTIVGLGWNTSPVEPSVHPLTKMSPRRRGEAAPRFTAGALADWPPPAKPGRRYGSADPPAPEAPEPLPPSPPAPASPLGGGGEAGIAERNAHSGARSGDLTSSQTSRSALEGGSAHSSTDASGSLRAQSAARSMAWTQRSSVTPSGAGRPSPCRQ